MADALTAKQEAFALAYVETGNATEAYRRAYDVAPDARDQWLYVEASQLLDHPKVSLRVAELQDQAARLSFFTIKAAFDEYEEARQLAMKMEAPAAAVSAIAGKVKLFGLDKPSRVALTGKDGGPIETKETGQGAAKVLAALSAIAERSGTAGGAAGE